jgi:hypothetical protein
MQWQTNPDACIDCFQGLWGACCCCVQNGEFSVRYILTNRLARYRSQSKLHFLLYFTLNTMMLPLGNKPFNYNFDGFNCFRTSFKSTSVVVDKLAGVRDKRGAGRGVKAAKRSESEL